MLQQRPGHLLICVSLALLFLHSISMSMYFFCHSKQRKADPGQFRQGVEWGLEAGYRHIDTASFYKNEEEVGEAISNKIKQGLVKREELYITTKVMFILFLRGCDTAVYTLTYTLHPLNQ